ncbi:CxxxxCH/CxxCH domain-containing protein [Streptomyces sp. NPDC017991]
MQCEAVACHWPGPFDTHPVNPVPRWVTCFI